jgi:Tfp pilus assembly protein PilF
VRLGIAACQYRKGNQGLARVAFERVLDLDPQNTEALQALAVMKLNSDKLEVRRVHTLCNVTVCAGRCIPSFPP